MIRRALLSAAIVLSFGAASAAPKYFGANTAPSLSVRAGVGGAARPGRWLPVDVLVAASDSPIRGSVIVEWGGATTRQDVDVAASSTSHVTLLLRTIAATPGVRVSLVDASDAVAATTDIPLSLLPVDDHATLCVGDTAAATPCSARVPESEAPTTWRGFDLADEVIWSAPPATGASSKAFAMWQAVRWWQDSGAVDPVVAPFDTESRLSDRTSLGLLGFVVALLVLSSLAVLGRAPLALIVGVPLVVAGAGVALLTRGSRDVDIQAASFVHEFDGAPQSLVLMRGEVEHPGAAMLELTPSAEDASVDLVHGSRLDSTTTIEGRAIYRATAGRGVRQRFELNGTLPAPWLSIEQHPGELVAANHAPFSLTDCEVRAEDRQPFGAIGAGATVRIPSARTLRAGDAIVCRLPPDWMQWSARGATVATRGSAFLILHMWPGSSPALVVPDAAR